MTQKPNTEQRNLMFAPLSFNLLWSHLSSMPAILFERAVISPWLPQHCVLMITYVLNFTELCRVNLELQQSLQMWAFEQSETIELLSDLTENHPLP